jgi:hypothetical protein
VLSVLPRWLIHFVCVWISRLVLLEISSSFLTNSRLILSSLVYPLTLLRKRISAASRRDISRFVVSNVSLLVCTFHKVAVKELQTLDG